MPGKNGTGPFAMGPMTGKAARFQGGKHPFIAAQGSLSRARGRFAPGMRKYQQWCKTAPIPGWIDAMDRIENCCTDPGIRGNFSNDPYRTDFQTQLTPQLELEFLNHQAQYFEKRLNQVKIRIDELEQARDNDE